MLSKRWKRNLSLKDEQLFCFCVVKSFKKLVIPHSKHFLCNLLLQIFLFLLLSDAKCTQIISFTNVFHNTFFFTFLSLHIKYVHCLMDFQRHSLMYTKRKSFYHWKNSSIAKTSFFL